MKNHRIKELKVGDKFGELTVISADYIYAKIKARRISYKVACTCGGEFYAVATKLRTGVITSCKDCSFKHRETTRDQVTQIEQLFTRYILNRVIGKDIEVSINPEQYGQLAMQDCYYCGEPPRSVDRFLSRKYVNTEPICINGIDRLDSNKGYELGNCVPCCVSCNYAKHKLSQHDFYAKVIKIYNRLELNDYKI